MDWALIIAGVAAFAAIASAVVAIVQARQASTSKKDADAARAESQSARDESAALAAKATDAFVRSAAAQEQANAMRKAELAPPDWTGPLYVEGSMYKAVNSSGRTIVIDHFDTKPDGTEGRMNIIAHEDGVYEYGESFSWLKPGQVMGGRSPEKFTAYWRFQDEPDSELNAYIIPL
jgi:hypothetical protein